MKLHYDNQRVLLTGASSGIGEAMAKILAAQGVKSLVLVARREGRLEALKQELIQTHPNVAVYIYPCDLSERTAIDHLLHYISREVGAVDILINNAGMGDYTLFENASWSKTEQMLKLNIQGLTYLTHKLAAPMVALGRGGILNVSSGLGLMFMPGMSVYAATKHYVTAFTESLRLELKGAGVVVSQLCPGPVSTEFGDVAGMQTGEMPAFVKLSAQQCAEEALAGFSQAKPMIIPGQVMRLSMGIVRLLPRSVMRLAFSGMRKRLLKEQQRHHERAVQVG
jgi:uncharacterized protein